MTAPVAFEVLRFAGGPVSGEVALLELEGRFDPGVARGRERARLVLETADGSLELPPAAVAALPEGVWRGSYAVPMAVIGGAVYSLAVSRDLLLDLPAPDVTATGGGPATHHVRLAREANELRARLDEAEAARNAAIAGAQEATATLDRERSAREEAVAARDAEAAALAEATAGWERAEKALAEAAKSAEEQAAAAREEAERELAEARTAHERALEEARAESERRQEETVAAERARASVTSHELRSSRAEAEALKRELAVRRSRDKTGANGAGDEAATRRAEPVPVPADAPTKVVEGETVRVLAARPPRPRHQPEDETQPSALPPGAAATGARSLEPAIAAASGSTRLLAVVALAVAVLAAILVVFLRVGIV